MTLVAARTRPRAAYQSTNQSSCKHQYGTLFIILYYFLFWHRSNRCYSGWLVDTEFPSLSPRYTSSPRNTTVTSKTYRLQLICRNLPNWLFLSNFLSVARCLACCGSINFAAQVYTVHFTKSQRLKELELNYRYHQAWSNETVFVLSEGSEFRF